MTLLRPMVDLWERLVAWWRSDLTVLTLEGDTLPDSVPPRRVVQMLDSGSSWSAGMNCPCGCGDVIELLPLQSVNPHWTLSVDRLNRPTLRPSVWRATRCGSHFWVVAGRIVWVE